MDRNPSYAPPAMIPLFPDSPSALSSSTPISPTPLFRLLLLALLVDFTAAVGAGAATVEKLFPLSTDFDVYCEMSFMLSLMLLMLATVEPEELFRSCGGTGGRAAAGVCEKSLHLRQPSKSISACMQPHSITLRSSQTKFTGWW